MSKSKQAKPYPMVGEKPTAKTKNVGYSPGHADWEKPKPRSITKVDCLEHMARAHGTIRDLVGNNSRLARKCTSLQRDVELLTKQHDELATDLEEYRSRLREVDKLAVATLRDMKAAGMSVWLVEHTLTQLNELMMKPIPSAKQNAVNEATSWTRNEDGSFEIAA